MDTSFNWEAPEPSKEYGSETISVTARPYRTILEATGLSEKEFVDKIILSVGNGLSDFVNKINILSKDQHINAHAIAVDPVYEYLGNNFDEFQDSLEKRGLGITGNMDEAAYDSFKETLNPNSLIAGDGTQLPIENASCDIVVISHIIDYVSQEVRKNMLNELLRVIKEDGEIRIPEVTFRADDGFDTISLTVPYYDIKKGDIDDGINVTESAHWFEILSNLQDKGCSLYTIRLPYAVSTTKGSLRFYKRERNYDVKSCQCLIIRKDTKTPQVLVQDYRDYGDNKNIKDINTQTLKIILNNSTVNTIHTEVVS